MVSTPEVDLFLTVINRLSSFKMKIAIKAGLTFASADTGVTQAASIMHSNTKLISMSETHKVTATHKDAHIHTVTVNILHLCTCTHVKPTQIRSHSETLNEEQKKTC